MKKGPRVVLFMNVSAIFYLVALGSGSLATSWDGLNNSPKLIRPAIPTKLYIILEMMDPCPPKRDATRSN